MLPPLPDLADYDISPVHGFLPDEEPLEMLSNPYYIKWEAIVSKMQPLLLSRRLHEVIDSLPVLSARHFHTEREWRRAYVVLVFMLHGYVWGGNQPQERIPPQITVPLFQVCEHLDIPPVATYAAVCLWNYKPIFPDEPTDNLSNLACINTFTGSMDEQWFYLVSVAIEAQGAPSIPLMLQAISAARSGDSRVVTECLQHFAEILDKVGTVLQRMYEHCDPHIFYHRIRPYLAGSKNMGDAGLPRGVMYDDGAGQEYRQYSGGSNAQSSLIQFFDIVLGIEHRPTGVGRNDGTSGAASKSGHGFIREMRDYMPGSHRRFLEHVDRVANIREFVESRKSDKALSCAYDACLAMLRALRDKHIQMVSRYIIVKSREARINSPTGTQHGPAALNLAIVRQDKPSNNKRLRGTGGTALIPFLKQARDETEEPAINAWAHRLLRDGPAEPRSATLSKVGEHADGHLEVVGLAGTWSADQTEGGICHW